MGNTTSLLCDGYPTFQHPYFRTSISKIFLRMRLLPTFNTRLVGNAILSLCGWPGYPAFNTLAVGNVRCSEWADRDEAFSFNTRLTGNNSSPVSPQALSAFQHPSCGKPCLIPQFSVVATPSVEPLFQDMNFLCFI